MASIDGHPKVLLPVFFDWLQSREQTTISNRYEEAANLRATPKYGLPDPEEIAAGRLHPDLESASAAARSAVIDGARNAYVIWHLMPAALLFYLGIGLFFNGGWVSRVTGVVLAGVIFLVARHKLARERVVLAYADAELGRLASGGSVPTAPATAAKRRLPAWAPGWALATAVVVGIFVLGLSLDDVVTTRGFPSERVELVAAVDNGSSGCGKYNEPRDLTWHSFDPPPGMPATFEEIKACNAANEAGDKVTIVRVVRDDGSVEVHVDPERSYAAAFGLAGFSAVFVLILQMLGCALWEWRRRRRSRE